MIDYSFLKSVSIFQWLQEILLLFNKYLLVSESGWGLGSPTPLLYVAASQAVFPMWHSCGACSQQLPCRPGSQVSTVDEYALKRSGNTKGLGVWLPLM